MLGEASFATAVLARTKGKNNDGRSNKFTRQGFNIVFGIVLMPGMYGFLAVAKNIFVSVPSGIFRDDSYSGT